MSNFTKRTEGVAEEAGGRLKEVFGKVMGSERLEAEGRALKLQGKAKQEAAKAAERVAGKIQETVGAIKNRVGESIGDEELEASGRAQEFEGQARQKLNN